MGNTFACVRHLEVAPHSWKSGSIESGHNETARPGLAGERGSSVIERSKVHCSELSLDVENRIERSKVHCSELSRDVENQIERSKLHWSLLTDFDSDYDNEEVQQENRQVFEELQSHSTWGHFFKTFGYDTYCLRAGELEVGEKFAEGGQAELFHAKVIWRHSKENDDDCEKGREWVLKVFKKGIRLRELQSQFPLGYLQWWAHELELSKCHLPSTIRYHCDVYCGTLLLDGRFAFLMEKEREDLRSRIDRAMLVARKDHGPFSKDEVERIMFRIALGMHQLHAHNILHRDLKASNVLVSYEVGLFPSYYVMDFECSIGVVGTGFFMAPEILQALKNKVVSKDLKVFSKQSDVYSYGMTCYEVLTGKLPFEGHPLNDYDLVLNGHRPRIPKYVDSWIKELLIRCWDADCLKRPLFPEIIAILSSNSIVVRRVQLDIQKWEEDKYKKYLRGYNKVHVLNGTSLRGDSK